MNREQPRSNRKENGYILLEVIVAITIFALAMAGIVGVLRETMQASNDFARDQAIRYGLRSILTEARHQDLDSMNIEYTDDELGISFQTEVEPLQLANTEGNTLKDLYVLRATANFLNSSDDLPETAEIWIYRGDEDEN